MSSLQQQQQLKLQQMQMQRQAIANAHSGGASAYTTGAPSNAAVPPNGIPQYTPQQIAAAAATAGLTGGPSGPGGVQSSNQTGSATGVPIRAYLDKTVIPILLDGTFYDVILCLEYLFLRVSGLIVQVSKNKILSSRFLLLGMSELVKERPSNPVQWLASYLIRHDPQNPNNAGNNVP